MAYQILAEHLLKFISILASQNNKCNLYSYYFRAKDKMNIFTVCFNLCVKFHLTG